MNDKDCGSDATPRSGSRRPSDRAHTQHRNGRAESYTAGLMLLGRSLSLQREEASRGRFYDLK